VSKLTISLSKRSATDTSRGVANGTSVIVDTYVKNEDSCPIQRRDRVKSTTKLFLTAMLLAGIVVMCIPAPVSAVQPVTRRFTPTYYDFAYQSSGVGTYTASAYASKYTGYLKGRVWVQNPPWPLHADAYAWAKISIKDTVPFESYITVRVNFNLQYYMRASGFFVTSRVYVMWEYSNHPWGHPAYANMWTYLYDESVGGWGTWPYWPVDVSYWQPWTQFTETVETEDHLKSMSDWLMEGMEGYTIITLETRNDNGGYVQWSSTSGYYAQCKVNWVEITYYPKYWP